MIGIVIVSHGGLAAELLRAAEHVMNGLERAEAIGLEPKDDLVESRAAIEAAVRRVDAGAGVVVLTDLFGGTPSNLAIATKALFEDVDVVTGANLPMLIQLAKSRGLNRREAVAAAVDAGRRYIVDPQSLMSGGASD